MHPNPVYRRPDAGRNIAFARERGFGVLTLSGPDGPLASHIPFVLNEAGDWLAAHVVRSNPIWRLLRDDAAKALVIVSGSDGYVSPDWYGVEDQVPTWNYVAVHLRGEVSLAPPETLAAHLTDLSRVFEPRIEGKIPWTMDKMNEEPLSRMMRMIAPIEMQVEAVEGTWKLSQNKADDVRLRAADAVETSAIGMEMAPLATLMRTPPD
jgi:transcriptional regulator